MWVVVMFEPAGKSESLTLSEQVDEVFGPFSTDIEADAWVSNMVECMPINRQYLVTQLSDQHAALANQLKDD